MSQPTSFSPLPPTLLPHAIECAAPPPRRRLSALFSLLVYSALATAGMELAKTELRPIKPKTRPDDPIVDLTDMPVKPAPPLPPIERVAPPTLPASTTFLDPKSLNTDDVTKIPDTLPTLPKGPVWVGEAGTGGESGGTNTGVAVAGVPSEQRQAQSRAPQVHDVSFSQLTILHQVAPLYPAIARASRIQGEVVLEMQIDETGVPKHVQVISGHGMFHEAAKSAALQWRFEPARVGGQAVSARFVLTIKFSLK